MLIADTELNEISIIRAPYCSIMAECMHPIPLPLDIYGRDAW